MDRQKFFDTLRNDPVVWPTKRLSIACVSGMETLLLTQEKYLPEMALDAIAYNFATAYHETAHTMQPIMERGPTSYFDKYEPGTKLGKILGNTQPGDGYRFRGAGHVQNTGRANAEKSSSELNRRFQLNTDFVQFPEQRTDPTYSALCLFFGNAEGWWTGRRLGDFLDGLDESDAEDIQEYMQARRVVNGIDKRELIAQYAMSFERAFKAAGYAPTVKKPIVSPTKTDLVEAIAHQIPKPQTSWFGLLWSVIFRR